MATAKPLARYGAIWGALRERLRYGPATPPAGTRPFGAAALAAVLAEVRAKIAALIEIE
jgi:hypothetical protein